MSEEKCRVTEELNNHQRKEDEHERAKASIPISRALDKVYDLLTHEDCELRNYAVNESLEEFRDFVALRPLPENVGAARHEEVKTMAFFANRLLLALDRSLLDQARDEIIQERSS